MVALDVDAVRTAGLEQSRTITQSSWRTTLSGALPAQKLADRDVLRREGIPQHRYARIRVGLAAHEHVEGGVAVLGPSVDGNVALGQDRDPRHPAVRLEVMQVDVQERRGRRIHRPPE